MYYRIQFLLAKVGLGSRRYIEKLIFEKKIIVDGKQAKLGDKVSLNQKISYNNKIIDCSNILEKKIEVIMINKPVGFICSKKDDKNRKIVFDLLPDDKKNWYMVGRLDINSSGLLLFTNNGELCYRLTHPKYNIQRLYLVRVLGCLNKSQIANIIKGIDIDNEILKFESIKAIKEDKLNCWYEIILKTGRNREVRRLFDFYNIKVNRLIRTSFANINLPINTPTKTFKKLDKVALNSLLYLVNLINS